MSGENGAEKELEQVDGAKSEDASKSQENLDKNPKKDPDARSQSLPVIEGFKLPMPFTPKLLLQHFSNKLTPFEMSEVLDFPRMYFFGQNANKIKGMPWAQDNNGYDDSRGDLRLVRHDHLAYRYELLDKLGKGSFGQVVKAFDHKTEEHVAIKIIRNRKRFHRQALMEIKILEHVNSKDCPSIVGFKGHFTFRNHLCLVFELLSVNLYELIKTDKFKGYHPRRIQAYAAQLLTCLDVLKKENIIHCDLKPENVLLDLRNKSTIKVIDFGSSCYGNEKVYTYIQSRFYRSPEVVMGLPYNTSIDMWSLGCILAELYTGYPLFPGENEVDLVARMIEILGTPPKELVSKATSKQLVFDPEGQLITPSDKSKPRVPGSKPLQTALVCQDSDFLDFLTQCLTWSKDDRMTPDQGLKHPWITKVYELPKSSEKNDSEVSEPLPAQPLPSSEQSSQPSD